MNKSLDWETVKEFYKENFGIDGWVVEVYANLDILTLCVSGSSNESIVKFLEIPIEDVKRVIKETFEFEGWDTDLPINPYKIFESNLGSPQDDLAIKFKEDVESALKPYILFRNLDAIGLYRLCKTLHDLERQIKDEWI